VNTVLDQLQARAEAQMDKDGIAKSRRRFSFALDMRHRGQINEVECVLALPRLKPSKLQDLHEQFYTRYEQLYGANASYKDARLEIVTLRVRASAATPRPALQKASRLSSAIPKAAATGTRSVYWDDLKKSVKTPIYNGAALKAGNRVCGPCVVETAQTNVVVHPGRTLRVDAYGNFEITFDKTPAKATR
jgi:N-methylhydantoinase A